MKNKVLSFNRRNPQPRKINIVGSLPNPNSTDEKMSGLNKFLAGYCGCADIKILQQEACKQDRKKYVTIGTSVVFTALLASCSGGFALFAAFKSVELAAGFGILWGAIILNIDRAMLINMTAKKAKDDTFGKKFVKAVPRLILSVAIGVVISTPLTLKIFESEIKAVMENTYIERELEQSENRLNQERKIKTNMAAIESEIQALQKRRAEAEKELTEETGGRGSSKIDGDGPTANTIKKRIADIDKQIEKQEKDKSKEFKRISSQLATVENNHKRESDARKNSNGLLDRITAREELTHDKKKPSAWWAIHGLELLMVAVETAPLLIKLMADRGNYEEILIAQQENNLRTSKDRELYQYEIKSKEEAIEYQSNLIKTQKKLLGVQADGDPKKLDEYVELVKNQFLKLDLNKQLFQKVLDSIDRQNLNEEAFDTALDLYRSSLSDADVDSYKSLFASLKELDQDILAQVISNLGSTDKLQSA
jgi:Domain of unknown function (DUF4407)